jgi:hypothetical protein
VGEHVIVSTFEYLDSAQPTGDLDIWQMSQEPRLEINNPAASGRGMNSQFFDPTYAASGRGINPGQD